MFYVSLKIVTCPFKREVLFGKFKPRGTFQIINFLKKRVSRIIKYSEGLIKLFSFVQNTYCLIFLI